LSNNLFVSCIICKVYLKVAIYLGLRLGKTTLVFTYPSQNINIKFKCYLKCNLSNTVVISIVNISCTLNDLISSRTSVLRMQ